MKSKLLIIGVFVILIAGMTLGQTWDFTKRLTYTSGKSSQIESAVDSGNGLHIVWANAVPGNFEIFWKMGLIGGTGVWTVPKRLTFNSGPSLFPSICIGKDDYIHVVWEDETVGNREIYHKFSTDNGNTWSMPERLSWTSGYTGNAHISSSGDTRVHLFYTDESTGDREIYYKQFDSKTKTWGTPKRLTFSSGDAEYPCGTSVQGDIHVVWQDDSNGNNELFHKLSTDNGLSWSSPTRITYNSGQSSLPRLVGFNPSGTTDSYLHLSWSDDTSGANEIYYKKWLGTTGTWQGLKRLTWVPTDAKIPTIAVDSNHSIHVIYALGCPVLQDLFHKKSLDIGDKWSSVTRLTWTSSSGSSSTPNLVISPLNDDLLLVYTRTLSPNNNECFFKRGSQETK